MKNEFTGTYITHQAVALVNAAPFNWTSDVNNTCRSFVQFWLTSLKSLSRTPKKSSSIVKCDDHSRARFLALLIGEFHGIIPGTDPGQDGGWGWGGGGWLPNKQVRQVPNVSSQHPFSMGTFSWKMRDSEHFWGLWITVADIKGGFQVPWPPTGGSRFIRTCLIRNWGLSELFSKPHSFFFLVLNRVLYIFEICPIQRIFSC